MFLGKQFNPSLDLLEIDITYQCNLKCYNCDRSCRQAPSTEKVDVIQIKKLLADSVNIEKQWKRIRILGGEPTLHPDIDEIISLLIDYKLTHNPDVSLELISNGYGKYVQNILSKIPSEFKVNNTNKTGEFQQKFEPFNLAPGDSKKHVFTDFSNGCWVTTYCGIGFNKSGFYPCGVGGSIDRILGKNLGLKNIPTSIKQIQEQMKDLCKLCGHFTFRNFTPIDQRTPVNGEPQSQSWIILYSEDKPKSLSDY